MPAPSKSRRPSLDRNDVLAWARHFLPAHFSDPPAPFHQELLGDLADPAARLIARIAPRGHAKSTCAAFAYPLWCVCERRRRNIVIVTHESSLATQFVRDLRLELESNERIIDAYGDLCRSQASPEMDAPSAGDPPAVSQSRPRGARRAAAGSEAGAAPLRPGRSAARRSSGAAAPRPRAAKAGTARPAPRRGKWSEAKFTTASGVTVQAKGRGGSFRGLKVGASRPDLVICDDLEDDAQVASPARRRKLEDWLRRVVLPALAPAGQVVVLGSLLHYDSLLANLRDRARFPHWSYRVYRALEARSCGDGQFALEALWPARWPVEKLQQERERVGVRAFEQEYLANPVDDRLRVFRPEWLRRYGPEELAGRELLTLMAVDPATGAADGDYFALWVGGVDAQTGVIYTQQLALERIGIVEQVKRIVAAFERWQPLRIGIETTAYQVALKDILEEYGRTRRVYLPIVALRTIANKRARIEGSAPFYENGTMRLPAALSAEVESQFLHFPKARHDDAPDVCAMGIELARSLRTSARIEGATSGANAFAREGGWA